MLFNFQGPFCALVKRLIQYIILISVCQVLFVLFLSFAPFSTALLTLVVSRGEECLSIISNPLPSVNTFLLLS